QRATSIASNPEYDPGKALDQAVAAATGHAPYEIRSALYRVLASNRQVYDVPASQPGVPGSGIGLFTLLDDRRTLAALSQQGSVLEWDLDSGELVRTVASAHDAPGWIVPLRDGNHTATVDQNGGVLLWTQQQLRGDGGAPVPLPPDPRIARCAAADADGGFWV